ncbi:hypothetical protein TNCV_2079781 [Trichonephila clavipes]|nr:hypothetical protein TNCV_2079781 [Trichonephila clavipes]
MPVMIRYLDHWATAAPWAGVELTTLGVQGQQQTNHVIQLAFARNIMVGNSFTSCMSPRVLSGYNLEPAAGAVECRV